MLAPAESSTMVSELCGRCEELMLPILRAHTGNVLGDAMNGCTAAQRALMWLLLCL